MITLKTARRLTDLFLTEHFSQSAPESKLGDAVLAVICRGLGNGAPVKGFTFWDGKKKKWLRSGYRGGRRSVLPGACCVCISSPPDVNQLNHSGMFPWEATEFVISVWAMRLLMEVEGGADAIAEAYRDMKRDGFQVLFDRVKRNPVSFYFDDPTVWDLFDENSVIENSLYLYEVFTGETLSPELTKNGGADLSYLNSFISRILSILEFECKYGEGGRIVIKDPLVREVTLMLTEVISDLDGQTVFSLLKSREMGWYRSCGKESLSRAKKNVLHDLFSIVMEGRRNDDLADCLTVCLEGMTMDGEFLSCVTQDYGSLTEENPWAEHAGALFHLLARQWNKDLS